MAKFKFRLATLLRLREAARDDRRMDLADAYRVDDLLKAQMEGVAEQLGTLRAICRKAASPGRVDVDRLVEAQRYELALRAVERQLGRQREAVTAEIERRRQALVEANREVRVLEKLREKQTLRHHQEENRRAIKQIDEAAAQRVARKEAR